MTEGEAAEEGGGGSGKEKGQFLVGLRLVFGPPLSSISFEDLRWMRCRKFANCGARPGPANRLCIVWGKDLIVRCVCVCMCRQYYCSLQLIITDFEMLMHCVIRLIGVTV